MIQDTLSVAICFALNATPNKVYELTDDSPYGAEGIALTDVAGIFKITAPDGTIAYENPGFATNDFSSPDIDADVSLVFNTANLPLDSLNEVQVGNHKVEYKAEVTGATQPGVYSYTKTVEFCHEDPTVTIEQNVDCFNSKLTSEDTTNYNISGVTTDSTARTHTAYPPPTSGLPNTVSSNKEIVASPIATKTWTLGVSTDVQWTYPDGLIVKNTLVGNKEVEVVCDISLCDIFCCIDKMYQKYLSLLGRNSVEASRQKAILEMVTLDLYFFQLASQCGDYAKAEAYYNHALDVSGCDPNCSCSDDSELSQIIPVCTNTGLTVVSACGNGAITVSANTVGDTTTYTVCFDQALLDKINAIPANANKQAIVPISSAEILDLHNTPKVLLAAQAGIGYDVDSVILIYKPVTTDYATTIVGDTGLRVHIVGPGGLDEARWIAPEDNLTNLNSLIALGYTNWANDMQDAFVTGVNGNPSYGLGDNTRLELKAVGGNFTLGDHTAVAIVSYREIPLS